MTGATPGSFPVSLFSLENRRHSLSFPAASMQKQTESGFLMWAHGAVPPWDEMEFRLCCQKSFHYGVGRTGKDPRRLARTSSSEELGPSQRPNNHSQSKHSGAGLSQKTDYLTHFQRASLNSLCAIAQTADGDYLCSFVRATSPEAPPDN